MPRRTDTTIVAVKLRIREGLGRSSCERLKMRSGRSTKN